MGRLDGRAALVTGAGRGIGRAIALALSREGCGVSICSRTESELRAVAEEMPGVCKIHLCDVTNPRDIEHTAQKSVEQFGKIDLFVSNAGEAVSRPLLETDVRFWNRMFTVHATAPLLFGKALVPQMRHHGFGRQVYVASTAAKQGAKYIAAYAAAKHAQVGLMRSMASEFGEFGVFTNAVCPGYVDTPMTAKNVEEVAQKTGRAPAEIRDAFAKFNRQGRMLTADEVAAAVVELCLPECARNGEAVDL